MLGWHECLSRLYNLLSFIVRTNQGRHCLRLRIFGLCRHTNHRCTWCRLYCHMGRVQGNDAARLPKPNQRPHILRRFLRPVSPCRNPKLRKNWRPKTQGVYRALICRIHPYQTTLVDQAVEPGECAASRSQLHLSAMTKVASLFSH
jgi:hypothetical protein